MTPTDFIPGPFEPPFNEREALFATLVQLWRDTVAETPPGEWDIYPRLRARMEEVDL